MLIEEALRQATDAQIKSEWARRTQAMRKSRKGGRPNLEMPAQAAALPNMESISTRDEYPRRMWPANEPPCADCGALIGHQKWCKAK